MKTNPPVTVDTAYNAFSEWVNSSYCVSVIERRETGNIRRVWRNQWLALCEAILHDRPFSRLQPIQGELI